MMQRISGKLTDYLLAKNIIMPDDREIYIYGIMALISTVVNFFVILFLGMFLGLFYETLVYLFGFALLRSYCGGYHARTQIGCVFSSVTMYLFSMAVYHYLPMEYRRMFSMILTAACFVFIYAIAPVEHKNRPFEGDEYRKFRMAARIIALVYVLIVYSISIFVYQLIMAAIVLSLVMLSVSIGLALGIVFNERSEY